MALSDQQATEIRDSDEPVKVLAERYGVSLVSIYNVLNGKTHTGQPHKPRGRKRVHFASLCECGCGQFPKNSSSRYCQGHASRVLGTTPPQNHGRTPRSADEFVAHWMDQVTEEDRGYRINGEPSACLIAQKVHNDGYARGSWKGRSETIHRILFEIEHDVDLERTTHVDHLCRQRGCLNVEHLEAVPAVVNIQRGACTPLTEHDVRIIRSSTKSRKELAAEYGMNIDSITHIINRQRWANVA